MKVFISFVLFGQKVLLVSRWSFWIWPSLCQSLSVKFVIIVKAQNVTPNIRLVMVILCKKMKWAIACGWRETFSGSHIYLFCAENSFCTFSYWNEDHQNCIKSFFYFVKRCICIYVDIYSVNTNRFHCGQLKVTQKNPLHSLLQIHMHFMLAITGCNYCGRRKSFMYS